VNPRNEGKTLLRIRAVPAVHFRQPLPDDLPAAEIERRIQARLAQLRWQRLKEALCSNEA